MADGVFARLFGCLTIRVNSLHGQAVLEPGDRVVVEGVAEDGTIEAIRIAGASAFASAFSGMQRSTHTPTLPIGPSSRHLEPRYVKATVLGAERVRPFTHQSII